MPDLTCVFALLGVTFSGSSCSLAGLSRTRFVVFGDVTSSFIFCEHDIIKGVLIINLICKHAIGAGLLLQIKNSFYGI